MYFLFPHVCQLTTTANDNSPELVAAVKRGPFACADENELVDYLLSRKKLSRAPVERYGLFHVVSYQRRLAYIKDEFFKRGINTPLGRCEDWWDRTLLPWALCLGMLAHLPAHLHAPSSCAVGQNVNSVVRSTPIFSSSKGFCNKRLLCHYVGV